MNVLILGQPRSGKTTIVKKIAKKGYNIIVLDEMRQAFVDSMPELDLNRRANEGKATTKKPHKEEIRKCSMKP